MTDDDILRAKLPWIAHLARERVPADLVDDVVQEALIALATVLRRWPDAPNAYLNASAKQTIVSAAIRQRWTGSTTRHGQPIDPLRRDRDSLDAALETGTDVAAPEEDLDLAAHAEEIQIAVHSLPDRQRRIVIERFWRAGTWPEVGQSVGLESRRAEEEWRRHAKPVLRERLAHLEGAA